MFLVILSWILVLALLLFHIWASRRGPKRWFLGGVVPLLWFLTVLVFLAKGLLVFPENFSVVLFPSLILIIIWVEGFLQSKKRIEKKKDEN